MSDIEHSFKKLEGFKERGKSRIRHLAIDFKNFDNLKDDDRLKTKRIANEINNSLNNKKDKYYYVIFQLTTFENRKKYSVEEILSILIETIDPKLLLLKIYLSSNTDFEIEKKSNRLFGFYDPILIDYEREYARRFYKKNRDKKIKKLVQ